MSRKLEKFVVLFDNTNLLYFPGQFLSGRVLVELKDDTQALGKSHTFFFCLSLPFPRFIINRTRIINFIFSGRFFQIRVSKI